MRSFLLLASLFTCLAACAASSEGVADSEGASTLDVGQVDVAARLRAALVGQTLVTTEEIPFATTGSTALESFVLPDDAGIHWPNGTSPGTLVCELQATNEGARSLGGKLALGDAYTIATVARTTRPEGGYDLTFTVPHTANAPAPFTAWCQTNLVLHASAKLTR